jgi:hypothetical protein
MIDVFITTMPGREEITRRSLESLHKYWDDQIRLTIHIDGATKDIESMMDVSWLADYVIRTDVREGLPMAINRCLSHIQTTNQYSEHPTAGDPRMVSDFICMVQDDIQYSPGWLKRLVSSFYFCERFNKPQVGFVSGIECPEHPQRTESSFHGMVYKDYIRAANMFGRRDYWMSMWPIPRYDPETRGVRAMPNDGIGSGVDWHFIRNHENSVVRTGRTCLVIPGLLQHIGYQKSTWLDRDLPESDSDIAAMSDVR